MHLSTWMGWTVLSYKSVVHSEKSYVTAFTDVFVCRICCINIHCFNLPILNLISFLESTTISFAVSKPCTCSGDYQGVNSVHTCSPQYEKSINVCNVGKDIFMFFLLEERKCNQLYLTNTKTTP